MKNTNFHDAFDTAFVFNCISTLWVTPKTLPTWTLPEGTIAHLGEEPINDIAYSPDGGLLAAASDSGIWLYDGVTHQEVARLVEHTDSVYSISFSPDGKTLASADSGREGLSMGCCDSHAPMEPEGATWALKGLVSSGW